MKIKKFLLLGLVFLILTNFLLGIVGVSSIFLTLSIYFLKWWLLKNLILILFKQHNELKDYLIILHIIIVGLFIVELSLKYIAKQNLSYTEANGSIFYHSPFQQPYLENFWYKYIEKKKEMYINTHKPYSSDIIKKVEFSYPHKYNSIGLRDDEPEKNNSLFTIVGMGDSFTEGVGSPQDSTWPTLLRKNLIEKAVFNKEKFQILNAGISGSDPVEQYFLLNEKLLVYSPNMVVLAVNNSDISDIILKGGKERWDGEKLKYRNGPWWEFFYSYSFIVRSVVHSFFQLNHLFMTQKEYNFEVEKAVKTIQNIIEDDFLKLSINHDFKLILVFHPMEHELKSGDFELQSLYKYFITQNKIYTINLYEEYKIFLEEKGKNINSIYWKVDGHHNSKGYYLWAKIIAKHINPLLIENTNKKNYSTTNNSAS